MSKLPKVTMVASTAKTADISPTQEIIHKNNISVTIIDAKGRSIILKKPNVLAQYRLVETLGESAKNEVYMLMVLPLLYVYSIDNIPVSINKKSELEALIQKLDLEGIDAVSKGVQENFVAEKSEEEVKEKIKK